MTVDRLRVVAAATRTDLLLQWRHGIVVAALAVAAVWVLVLRALPVDHRVALLPVVLYADAGVVGLTFVGGQVLIERRQRVLAALGTSPVTPGVYVAGKLTSLTALAVVASCLVVAGAGGVPVTAALLVVPPVVVLSVLCLVVGLLVAARVDDVTRFLLLVQLPLAPVLVPLLAAVGWVPWSVALVVPTTGPLAWLTAAVAPSGSATTSGPPAGVTAGATVFAVVVAVAGVAAAVRTTAGRLLAVPPDMASGPATGGTPGTGVRAAGRVHGAATTLLIGDARRIVRDPVTAVLLVGPLLVALVARVGVPVLERVPAVRTEWESVVLRPTLLALLLLVAALLHGAVAGLLLLEERDEGALRAVLVTPLPRSVVLGRRAAAAAVATLLTLAAAVPLSGLAPAGTSVGALAAGVVVAAAAAPVVALLLPALAADRLAALAVMKALSLPFLLPLLAPAADGPAAGLLRIVPTWWVVTVVQRGAQGRPTALAAAVGVGLLTVLSALLFALLRRRLAATTR